MDTITLRHTLPRVFRGSETEPPVCHSEVWLRPEISFSRPGRYVIEAESGTGKSSLCAYIYGSRTDYDGEILFDGTDIRTFGINRWCELRRRALAYLPQEMRLFPELTAMENLMIKNRLTDFHTEAELRTLLERVELGAKADIPAGRLSVGQQQRVAIVRALCQPFDFLLVDEPVSHLDARNNASVAALIASEAEARNAALIATSVGNKLSITDYKLLHL
ncbi:MAG: ATP-binding cassette domain-containing protein [Muribaculaceae bacterium]|nr:ATP-binding cassette domain-containing protein [Muribaculaceae bacterium]